MYDNSNGDESHNVGRRKCGRWGKPFSGFNANCYSHDRVMHQGSLALLFEREGGGRGSERVRQCRGGIFRWNMRTLTRREGYIRCGVRCLLFVHRIAGLHRLTSLRLQKR